MFSNYPQQLIPFRALAGWVARIADTTQRQVDNKADFLDKQIQLLMMSIPGLSQKVPARLGPDGKPIMNDNAWLNAFSPIRVSNVKFDWEEFLQKSEDIRRKGSQSKKESVNRKVEARKLYDEFSGLPKEEANRRASELKKSDAPLYNALRDIVTVERKDLSPLEKRIMSLGVENGDRAEFIWAEVEKLGTREEKNTYIKNLRQKKVITDAVMGQLRRMKK